MSQPPLMVKGPVPAPPRLSIRPPALSVTPPLKVLAGESRAKVPVPVLTMAPFWITDEIARPTGARPLTVIVQVLPFKFRKLLGPRLLLFWLLPAAQPLVVIIAAWVILSHWAEMLPVRVRVPLLGIWTALMVPLPARPSFVKFKPANVLLPMRFSRLGPFMVTTVETGICWGYKSSFTVPLLIVRPPVPRTSVPGVAASSWRVPLLTTVPPL